MSIQAFVDNGYPEGSEFLTQFLSSPDFSNDTLQKLSLLSNRCNKRQKALEIIDLLDKGELSEEEIMLAYVKQTRVWLSLKQKEITIEKPRLREPLQLLKKILEKMVGMGRLGILTGQSSGIFTFIKSLMLFVEELLKPLKLMNGIYDGLSLQKLILII